MRQVIGTWMARDNERPLWCSWAGLCGAIIGVTVAVLFI